MMSHDAARSLAGKVALVTGAGRGLGRAFAERLASLGADVAIHGMRSGGIWRGHDPDCGRGSGGRGA
jgi:3-oxoacyl-[acyl-carrier protein] reductase